MMPKPLKLIAVKKVLPKEKRSVSPLLWYGGKQSMADFIIGHFPPHKTFVEVFGGGGAVMFRKMPGYNDVLNDIGNCIMFYRVLRDYPEETYEKLHWTPHSRDELYYCRKEWKHFADQWNKLSDDDKRVFHLAHPSEAIEWARCWYTTIIVGYAHEESESTSYRPSKTQDMAFTWQNRVDQLPWFAERLLQINLENLDFEQCIKLYDSETTMFFCDPPYTEGSRAAQGNYIHEMPNSEHRRFLKVINSIKGQAIVSMYSDPLYEKELSGWRRDEITRPSSVQNSKSMADGRDTRTEVLWLKEHHYGLWTPFPMAEETSPDVSRETDFMEELTEGASVVREGEVV
jgi:DNA adenine methylase